MTRKTPKPPSYRQRKGYTQALVTLTDAATKQRHDYWLGEYGSPQSRELYHQVLAEWEANGRRLPPTLQAASGMAGAPTVAEVVCQYWRWALTYYSRIKLYDIRAGIRLMRKMFGHTSATDFGPKKLRLVREEMIRGDSTNDPPRKPWSRPYVNQQCRYIRHMFKWAASHELLPAGVYEQLRTIEPLRRGRTQAREPEPVTCVSDEMVDAIKPFVSQQVWAIIELQRLTGARGGELFTLRRSDIGTSGEIWMYTPNAHKTAHHGKTRTIYFGPRAQAAVRPFLLDRPVDACLFSPVEAEAERRQKMHDQRKTPLSCGNRPGTNRIDNPGHIPGSHYTRDSYHRAIQRACDEAFPPPPHLIRQRVPADGRLKNATRWETDKDWQDRLGPKRWAELLTWRKTHRWHPHQLRHAAGTRISREFGLEAAQIALGHSSALVTDAVYAERDMTKAVEIMKKIG